MIVTPENATIVMDGTSAVPINVKILDNNNKPISGQQITFRLLEGSGKVTVIKSVTSEEGIALGEYEAGYGNEPRTARVLIKDRTGLEKTVTINEELNVVKPGKIIIEADTESDDILKNGLTISVTLLDTRGNPMADQTIIFTMIKGSGTFFGFRMMEDITDTEGKAEMEFNPRGSEEVEMRIETEGEGSISETLTFIVK